MKSEHDAVTKENLQNKESFWKKKELLIAETKIIQKRE